MGSGTGHNTRARTRDAGGAPPDGNMDADMEDPENPIAPADKMFQDGDEDELELLEPPGIQDPRPPSTPRHTGPPNSIGSANSQGTSKRNAPSVAGRSGPPGASPSRAQSEGRGNRSSIIAQPGTTTPVLDAVLHMETLYSHYNEALVDYNNSRDQLTLAEASATRQKFNLAWKEVQRIYTKTINSIEDATVRGN